MNAKARHKRRDKISNSHQTLIISADPAYFVRHYVAMVTNAYKIEN